MSKLLVYSVLLATVIIAVNSYNFDDSDFNQILSSDLQYLYNTFDEPNLHVRHRRDEESAMPEKCRPRRKKLCCAESVMDKLHDSDKDLKKSCFKEINGKDVHPKAEREDRGEIDPFRCDRVERHRKEMTCISQCVGQKKNILDEDGNVKESEFTEFIKDNYAKESWFSSLQDKIISTCLAEAENATANADKDKDACNPAGVKLAHCMFRETQLNCPADQIKDEKSCTRLQERLKKKEDSTPPPQEPFLHDE